MYGVIWCNLLPIFCQVKKNRWRYKIACINGVGWDMLWCGFLYMGCLKKTRNFWKNDCNRGVSQIFECVIMVLSIYV